MKINQTPELRTLLENMAFSVKNLENYYNTQDKKKFESAKEEILEAQKKINLLIKS